MVGGGPGGSVIIGFGTGTADDPATGVLPADRESLHSGANIQYALLTTAIDRANPIATKIGEFFFFGIDIL